LIFFSKVVASDALFGFLTVSFSSFLTAAYLRSETRGCFTLKRVIIGLLILLTVAVALTLVIVLATRPVRLYNNVKATNIMTHLKELEAIAYQPHNHGSRSIVNGYADSAQYIIEQLQEFTDCNVRTLFAMHHTHADCELRGNSMRSIYVVGYQARVSCACV
jgi:hypothetical protein